MINSDESPEPEDDDEKAAVVRRGKATKGKKGEAAKFEPGGAKGPKVFDVDGVCEKLHLYWENGDGQTFTIGELADGYDVADAVPGKKPQIWSRWPEKKIVNLLRTEWVRIKTREGEILSEADRVLLHVMKKRRLEASVPALAGYPSGIHDINGAKVLVRSSPRLIVPAPGEWPTVKALIHAKLDFTWGNEEGHGVDQTPYFYGWLRTALEALYRGGPGNFMPGQTCIFAGPADCGKSRLQHQIITPLLGGRSADPGPYFFGRTDFNEEMFGAEHLMMEDPASSTKTQDRVFFGEMLKQFCVNDTLRLHAKRESAVTVSPFFRVTISINDDPDKMRVLPLLTPDMKDKVMLFLISNHALPMAANSLDERKAFRDQVTSELPAFAWWLLHEFELPEGLAMGRMGVKHWHHPALSMELFDDTPAAELLQIIDAAFFKAGAGGVGMGNKLWDLKSHAKEMGDEWSGSAIDLERLLLGDDEEWKCTLEREAKKVCMHNKIDRLLSRLKEDQPKRVVQWRTNSQRGWTVTKPE